MPLINHIDIIKKLQAENKKLKDAREHHLARIQTLQSEVFDLQAEIENDAEAVPEGHMTRDELVTDRHSAIDALPTQIRAELFRLNFIDDELVGAPDVLADASALLIGIQMLAAQYHYMLGQVTALGLLDPAPATAARRKKAVGRKKAHR